MFELIYAYQPWIDIQSLSPLLDSVKHRGWFLLIIILFFYLFVNVLFTLPLVLGCLYGVRTVFGNTWLRKYYVTNPLIIYYK